jgi:hypothetical protein
VNLATAALLVVIVALLALPTTISPGAVADLIRSEHELNTGLLGEASSRTILARASSWLDELTDAGRGVGRLEPPVGDTLSTRLAMVSEAVLDTPYFVRLRALGRLVAYRLASLLEWMLFGAPLLGAAILDGVVTRAVKARTLVHLSPVLFGLGVHGSIAVLAGVLLLLVIPMTVQPLVAGGLVLLLAMTWRFAASNFHRLR